MRLCSVFVGILAAVCQVVVEAQTAPKPGPEHKRLEVWAGSWSTQGEVKPGNAYGVAAGKFMRTDRFQWVGDGFFLQLNREIKDPAGEVRHLSMIGYDPVARKYTWAWFDLASGASASFTMTNNGNTWITTGGGTSRAGKPFQERCTSSFASPVLATFQCETSADGKTWSPAIEGKATKAK